MDIKDNNKMINLNKLMTEYFKVFSEVYIPLLQRNYKWDKQCASKLATDLWESFLENDIRENKYTIGMITFYYEDKDKLQLIDGQQRIITLSLLLKLMEYDGFPIKFERDKGVESEKVPRSSYLSNIDIFKHKLPSEKMYTDLFRFKENYEEMLKELLKKGFDYNRKDEFVKYIFKKVYILLHITETEPLDEFLNINVNKTRFVISDYIKANLIIDNGDEQVDKNKIDTISRADIVELFRELSYLLFYDGDNNKYIWELVSQGYECDADENRLKVLFCDRYEGNNKMGYIYDLEYMRLDYYKKILKQILVDTIDNNWNLYNGFMTIHIYMDVVFFDMFGKKYQDTILKKHLEEIMWKLIKKKHMCYVNGYIESQLLCDKIDSGKIEKLQKEEDCNEWIHNAKNELKDYEELYKYYIQAKYRERIIV